MVPENTMDERNSTGFGSIKVNISCGHILSY
jgi:hypothetical protein